MQKVASHARRRFPCLAISPRHRPGRSTRDSTNVQLTVGHLRAHAGKDKAPRTEKCLLPDYSLSEPIDILSTASRFARRGYVVVLQGDWWWWGAVEW